MKKITGLLSLLTMMTLTFFACTTVEKSEPIDMANLKQKFKPWKMPIRQQKRPKTLKR